MDPTPEEQSTPQDEAVCQAMSEALQVALSALQKVSEAKILEAAQKVANITIARINDMVASASVPSNEAVTS